VLVLKIIKLHIIWSENYLVQKLCSYYSNIVTNLCYYNDKNMQRVFFWSKIRVFIQITSTLSIQVQTADNAAPTQGSSYKSLSNNQRVRVQVP